MGQLGFIYIAGVSQTTKWIASLDSTWLGTNDGTRRQLLQQIFNRVGITDKAYTIPRSDPRVFSAGSFRLHPNASWNGIRSALGITVIETTLTTSLDAPLWLPTLATDRGDGGTGNQWTATEIEAMNALGGFMVLEFGSTATTGDGWYVFDVNSLNAINSPYVGSLVDTVVVGDFQFFNQNTQANATIPAQAVTYLDSSANVPANDVIATIENTGNAAIDGLPAIFAT